MRKLLFFLALGMLIAIGCETDPKAARVDEGDTELVVEGDGTETAEVVITLDEVPNGVMSAAKKAVPGIKFTRVERELEGGIWVYDMEGTANGVAYEIEVAADGTVLEIEKEDGDEEDDDDDDDHDDDDDDDDDHEEDDDDS